VKRANVWLTFGPRLLSRLRVVEQKYADLRVERILAFSRLFLSLTCLAAWFIAPARTNLQHRFGMSLLSGYVVSRDFGEAHKASWSSIRASQSGANRIWESICKA